MAVMSEQASAATIDNKQTLASPSDSIDRHPTETIAMDLDVNGENKEESTTTSLQEHVPRSSFEEESLMNSDQKVIAAPPSPPIPTPPLRVSIDGTQNLSDLHITSPPGNQATMNMEEIRINSSPPLKSEEMTSPGTRMDMDVPISPLTTVAPLNNTQLGTTEDNFNKSAVNAATISADQEMKDAPPILKTARDREEDDEESGRPTKRAKTDELTDEKRLSAQNQVSAPSEPRSTIPKAQAKYALATIRVVKRIREAGPFLQPVDPIKLDIPTYFDYVKEPMDLSTMEKKLQGEQYATVEEFRKDFNLIISNCLLFNGPDHQVSEMAKKIQAVFEKQMEKIPPANHPEPLEKKAHKKSASIKSSNSTKVKPTELKIEPVDTNPAVSSTSTKVAAKSLKEQKSSSSKKSSKTPTTATPAFAVTPSGIPQIRRESTSQGDGRPKREIHPPPSRDLPYAEIKPRRKKTAVELKFCENVMKELLKKQHETFAYPFYTAVDPVALNIPEYFKIIKKPMDLSAMQHKLKTNQYDTANEFETDMKLMLSNCFKFNPVGTPVHIMGKKMEDLFYKKWAEKASFIHSQSGSRSPVSTSPPPGEEEEMSEDEPATHDIASLENELAALKNKLTKMKQKEKKTKSAPLVTTKTKGKTVGNGGRKSSVSVPNPPAPKKSGKKATSKKEEDFKHISLEEKLELSERINLLPPAKMVTAMAMIQQNMPNLAGESVDEIELDIDELPPAVLYKLYQYVFKHTPPLSQKEHSDGYIAPHIAESSRSEQKAAPRAKKNKPMSALEQEAKIKALSEKLNSFENPTPARPAAPAAGSDSESSEEVESSGSESEEE